MLEYSSEVFKLWGAPARVGSVGPLGGGGGVCGQYIFLNKYGANGIVFFCEAVVWF
jgi:hypothetical protein